MSISQVASQAGGATVDASATASRAFPSNVTSGNLVYIGCSTYNGNGATTFTAGSCTKSAGTATLGTISLDKQISDAGTNITAAIWSAVVTGSGSLTLQIAGTDANNYYAIGSDELSATNGWDGSRVETTNSGTGNATTQTTGNMTSAGGAAFVGVTALGTGINETSYTKAAAYTQIYKETDGVNHQPGLIEIHIVSSGTTEAATTTLTGAKPYAAVGAVYKEVAGGGGGGTPANRLGLLGVGF